MAISEDKSFSTLDQPSTLIPDLEILGFIALNDDNTIADYWRPARPLGPGRQQG